MPFSTLDFLNINNPSLLISFGEIPERERGIGEGVEFGGFEVQLKGKWEEEEKEEGEEEEEEEEEEEDMGGMQYDNQKEVVVSVFCLKVWLASY